ncbi:unnamed protein product, partial [Brachionus calyciflorus]
VTAVLVTAQNQNQTELNTQDKGISLATENALINIFNCLNKTFNEKSLTNFKSKYSEYYETIAKVSNKETLEPVDWISCVLKLALKLGDENLISLGESALKLGLKANIKIPTEILSELKLEEELGKNSKDEVQPDEEKFDDALVPEVTDPNFIDILKALTKSININKSLRIETTPSQNVSSWFERFELLTTRWSKEEKGLEVQHMLKELRPNFSTCNLIAEFFSAKQNPEETIDKFAHRLLEYTRKAKCEQRKLFEENICYVFRRGCDKKVQNFLVTDMTNDFNLLWSLAKTIENNNNEQEEMSLNKISEVPIR